MVKSCCVFQCTNRAGRDKGVSFFKFPINKHKRRAWERAINRKDWRPNNHSVICSVHFVDGWHGDEQSDPNYAPTLFSYKQCVTDKGRENRAKQRHVSKIVREKEEQKKKTEKQNKDFSLFCHSYTSVSSTAESDVTLPSGYAETGVQCDTDPLLLENMELRKENEELLEQLKKQKWGVHRIKDNNQLTKFYTGLPTFAVFLWLFNFMSEKAERMRFWSGEAKTSSEDRAKSASRTELMSLSPVDQFLAVLMRLKVGLFVQDLAERFSISKGTMSKYIYTWVSLLHKELKVLNPFPSKDCVQRNMPNVFKIKYPSTRIIIDCTEVFVQRPSKMLNQSAMFSSYKHHTTIKFLVGITPSGVISFVSDGWSGRTSDKEITEKSGLINLLERGDSVMADKGFTISDLLEKRGCSLNIPPFLGALGQFSTEQVFKTREIAELRIHVERSIGRVKNFHIFDGVFPLSVLPQVTEMFQVCCWLSNLDVPLVK